MQSVMVIFFVAFIALCVVMGVDMNNQRRNCEAQGGTFVYNQHGSNLCYPPGTLLRIN